MAEQDNDKTERATPFKLREARKRGQVAKSLELNSLFVIAAFLGILYLWGGHIASHQLLVDRVIFEQAAKISFEIPRLVGWFGAIFNEMTVALTPFLVILIFIVVLSNIIQTGPVFTFFPLKPDIKRINPVDGFKRVFSAKLLFEAIKNLIKLVLFSAIIYFVIRSFLPALLGMMQSDPSGYPRQLNGFLVEMIFKLGLALLLVALLDFVYTRWDYSKKMRMSTREVKEEYKRREGDPKVRARMRELQREAAQRAKSLKRVPDADVLITNPSRLAVGISYRRGEMAAPRIIAKGAGDMAKRMKNLARRNQVPIVEDKPLARRLFRKIDIDQELPEEFYPAIARILAAIYSTRETPQGLPG